MEWNSIDAKGKPKRDGKYLVTLKDGTVQFCYYTNDPYKLDKHEFAWCRNIIYKMFYEYDSHSGYNIFIDGRVIAWAKIPKPYKEEEVEQ